MVLLRNLFYKKDEVKDMEFKLILVPETPDKKILKAEKPLAGLAFIEAASECLRRNLDGKSRMRHETLGAVAQYEISVPQAVAIESGVFATTNTVYIPCEENFLADYIFYGATIGKTSTRRQTYPYYTDEIVLSTYVDELAVIDVWRNRNFPTKLTIHLSTDIPMVDEADEDNVNNPNVGDLVLDDLLK
jgi:hypothetical protein